MTAYAHINAYTHAENVASSVFQELEPTIKLLTVVAFDPFAPPPLLPPTRFRCRCIRVSGREMLRVALVSPRRAEKLIPCHYSAFG